MHTTVAGYYRTLVELAFKPIFVRERNGRILEWNHGAQELYGFTAEEAVGAISHELLKTRFPTSRSDMEAALVRDGFWRGVLTHTSRDGERITVESAHQVVVQPGGMQLVLETDRDIRRDAADLAAIAQLHRLGTASADERELHTALMQIVDTAIGLTGADCGVIQLLDESTGDLRIAAQRGFPDGWVERWNTVPRGQGVCGTALERGERVIVEDVTTSPIFMGTDALDVELGAGVRAVQSTPLGSRSGTMLGMLSTHYRTPGAPSALALRHLDLLARQAADLIERARVTEALRDSELRFRSFFENAAIGAAQIDPQGRFTQVNDRLCRITGYARDELLGMGPLDLDHPDEVEADRRRIEDFFRTNAPYLLYEKRYVHKAGHVVWVRVTAAPIRDDRGAVYTTAALIEDITERRHAEEAVTASERKYRQLHESMRDAFVAVDMAGRIQDCNEAYREMLGYTDAELRQLRYVDLTPPRWHAMEAQIVAEQILRTGSSGVYEKEYRRKDGAIFPIELRTFLIRDDAGQPQQMWAIVRDITERKHAEEALREADRRKDEFLATLAHELRNPLAPIRNGLHILQRSGKEGKAAEQAIEMMERQVNHIVRLVDDLMEVSRIVSGKIELRKERVDLSDVLHRAVETSRPHIDAAGHRLTFEPPSEPLRLEADPVRLTQVIANVLNNAAKYTPENGKIWLSARREGANAVVSVRDSGVGISAQMLPKVFDLFTQVDRTHGTQGGLGIGLTLARRLVEMHGGSIRAKSDGPGKGSEFVLRLPLVVASHGQPDSGRHQDRADTVPPRRILVVDDDQDVALSSAILLELMGAEVMTANDGTSALEMIRTHRPSVVILDIGMPQMNGYEFARQVRRMPGGREVTLIAVTGWDQEQVRQRSSEVGIDHVLVKPAAVGELEALLAKDARSNAIPGDDAAGA